VHRITIGARSLCAVGLLFTLLGVPLLAVSVAAQHGSESVMRVQQRFYPDSLDPQQSSGVEFSVFLSTNYEGLTRLDQDLSVVPAAAESWEADAAGTTLIFHLRPDLTYSDGSPLTAERFADAVRRACDPNVLGDYQAILFDVAGCQDFATLYTTGEGTPVAAADNAAYDAARAIVGVHALDERTLQVQLIHPAPYFPAIASLPVFYPAKRELIAQGGDTWWQDPAFQLGNGPFQVTRMEPDQLVSFVANAHYWDGHPALDRLDYVYVADSSVALEAYQAGDLDMVSLDPALLPSVIADPQLNKDVVRIPGAATSYLSFNLTKEPFTDKHVREAFAYAFDRETYCRLLQDEGCAPALSWIPPGLPGHITADTYAFDPEKARQALADSSYGGPEQLPKIDFVYWAEDPAIADRVEWIAEQFSKLLGVTITLQPKEGKAMVAAMSDATTYPAMTLTGWIEDYPDPQNWLSVYWACRTSFAQDVGFCDPKFDTLVAQADREPDPIERQMLYEQAGRLLVDDVPGVFVSHAVFLYLVKPAVTGYTPTPIDAGWPGQTTSLLTVSVGQ
jgi:oligopeptide transport system substrate-binding protein